MTLFPKTINMKFHFPVECIVRGNLYRLRKSIEKRIIVVKFPFPMYSSNSRSLKSQFLQLPQRFLEKVWHRSLKLFQLPSIRWCRIIRGKKNHDCRYDKKPPSHELQEEVIQKNLHELRIFRICGCLLRFKKRE